MIKEDLRRIRTQCLVLRRDEQQQKSEVPSTTGVSTLKISRHRKKPLTLLKFSRVPSKLAMKLEAGKCHSASAGFPGRQKTTTRISFGLIQSIQSTKYNNTGLMPPSPPTPHHQEKEERKEKENTPPLPPPKKKPQKNNNNN